MAADQSRWRYVITSVDGTNTAGGGIAVFSSDKQYSHNINAGRTGQFSINTDHPIANFILTNDCLCKVYRKSRAGLWVLLAVGDVIHVEENGDGNQGTITVVMANPWWRLQRRLLGTTVDALNRGLPYSVGSAGAPVDLGLIIHSILSSLNSVVSTGIADGSNVATSNSYIGPIFMQSAGDIIQQVCTTLGAPDFDLLPVEPSGTMPNTTIAILNTLVLGSSQPNAVFEYGTGSHNVSGYTRILSKDGLANQIFSPQQGYPSLPAAGDAFVSATDGSFATVGLFQDIVQSDVGVVALRQQLANEYLAVRKQARQQITVTPSVSSNVCYPDDFTVGDTVTLRAMVNGVLRFNGTARVYGVSIAVDENDAETQTLTLIPGG